ncbi:hypothetical protein COV61_00080 [Candidatus Micrarchaeota archaeon CG11_big_fil_rev_8_21_14_0_20_47_5]|nr:MAG: hypothetical protein AUJ17_00610 [Candidatus Micrarchaeota archaeon CG1_02_47_40]PIN84450.1 MAG: hypothetical protein COV61_00080 [Candidatus Micrarchaeota archaeon CG11_big_fil_rev_8_21_14_0_20_47_5]
MDEFETSAERYNRLVQENLRKMQNEDSIERLFAARELARIAKRELHGNGEGRIVFELARMLEFRMRMSGCGCEEIIWALGAIGSEDAADILIKAMDDKIADIRLKAVKALGKIGRERAKNALIGKLKDALEKENEPPEIMNALRKALEEREKRPNKNNGYMNYRKSFWKRRTRILTKIARAIIPFID